MQSIAVIDELVVSACDSAKQAQLFSCPRLNVAWRFLRIAVRNRSSSPFTDWQNDLHLISGINHELFLSSLSNLATLITAAAR